MLSLAAVLAPLATASGCEASGTVELLARRPASDPMVGLTIRLFPFDPDRLLDSLAAAAPSPRPTFPELEAELVEFRAPDEGTALAAAAPWQAVWDSAARLADSLARLDRRTSAYAALYARFREVYARLAQRMTERDRVLHGLGGASRQLVARARAAAESLRAWETEAYAGFAELAATAAARTGRAPRQVATDSAGTARLALEPGRWWVVARLPDPENPFQELYWNVPIRVARGLPFRVPLVEETARRRWRH